MHNNLTPMPETVTNCRQLANTNLGPRHSRRHVLCEAARETLSCTRRNNDQAAAAGQSITILLSLCHLRGQCAVCRASHDYRIAN